MKKVRIMEGIKNLIRVAVQKVTAQLKRKEKVHTAREDAFLERRAEMISQDHEERKAIKRQQLEVEAMRREKEEVSPFNLLRETKFMARQVMAGMPIQSASEAWKKEQQVIRLEARRPLHKHHLIPVPIKKTHASEKVVYFHQREPTVSSREKIYYFKDCGCG